MLDISNGGGDFTPWVKYNAKAGRWYVKGESGDMEVEKPVFVADFANIKTGWFYYASGQAPEVILDPALNQRAEKPDRTYTDSNGKVKDCFKRGFALNLFSASCFGGVVELSGTSATLSGPINDLYMQYEKSEEMKAGKLPVIAFVKSDAITGQHGTNYTPVFEIQKWVDRPAEFDSVSPVAANEAASSSAPAPAAASGGVSEF
jgi:hypothetical protein